MSALTEFPHVEAALGGSCRKRQNDSDRLYHRRSRGSACALTVLSGTDRSDPEARVASLAQVNRPSSSGLIASELSPDRSVLLHRRTLIRVAGSALLELKAHGLPHQQGPQHGTDGDVPRTREGRRQRLVYYFVVGGCAIGCLVSQESTCKTSVEDQKPSSGCATS